MSSIFIQIPSYRDFELNKTVASAVSNASGLNKLSFGVHNCILFDGEIEVKTDYPEWVRVSSTTSIAPNNIGVNISRSIANEFYNGEDYYLQTDSHMRFVKNWDVSLIDGIKKYQDMGISKPLITQYPPEYLYLDDGTETVKKYDAFYQCGISFEENTEQFKNTLIPTQTAKVSSNTCGYIKSVSGGSIFTLGEFSKIKPNQTIAFWGEEPLIAARAFTHGFDLVMPFSHAIFHLYHSQQTFAKVRRHHVWADFPEIWAELDAMSKTEYKKIFTERVIGDGALGGVRTLDEYEQFSGLNFRDGTINTFNEQCLG
jgi:hypothetical protein